MNNYNSDIQLPTADDINHGKKNNSHPTKIILTMYSYLHMVPKAWKKLRYLLSYKRQYWLAYVENPPLNNESGVYENLAYF